MPFSFSFPLSNQANHLNFFFFFHLFYLFSLISEGPELKALATFLFLLSLFAMQRVTGPLVGRKDSTMSYKQLFLLLLLVSSKIVKDLQVLCLHSSSFPLLSIIITFTVCGVFKFMKHEFHVKLWFTNHKPKISSVSQYGHHSSISITVAILFSEKQGTQEPLTQVFIEGKKNRKIMEIDLNVWLCRT